MCQRERERHRQELNAYSMQAFGGGSRMDMQVDNILVFTRWTAIGNWVMAGGDLNAGVVSGRVRKNRDTLLKSDVIRKA